MMTLRWMRVLVASLLAWSGTAIADAPGKCNHHRPDAQAALQHNVRPTDYMAFDENTPIPVGLIQKLLQASPAAVLSPPIQHTHGDGGHGER